LTVILHYDYAFSTSSIRLIWKFGTCAQLGSVRSLGESCEVADA
jgi:hypothetical protein